MIYIDMGNVRPNAEWLARANELTNQLRNATPEERNQIIEDNARVWRELADVLLDASNRKCWYSENKVAASHVDVDHFRPKASAKNLDLTKRDGYWWLVFDYRNYRAAGSMVNRDKKKDMFPLRENSIVCQMDGNVEDEQPYFLDPTVRGDVILLTFDEEGRTFCSTDSDWEKERVKVTVEYLKLDDPRLRTLRKTKWQECQALLERAVEEKIKYNSGSIVARAKYEEILEQLRWMKMPEQEFSSTVRSFLKVKDTKDIPTANLLAQ